MKQNKGFTLIELLAVIVILAVIAFIATPLIMGTIEKAKVNAYKDTVYGIIKSAENYVAEELLKEDYQGETLDLSSETKLKYKGTKPTKGSMTLLPSGSISLAIQNGKYCYMKRSNTNEVEVTTNAKECSIRVANNLVKNGYGEYGDNTNFSQYIFSNGIFSKSANNKYVLFSDELIPIDTNKKYEMKITAKTNQADNQYFLGIAEYDNDKKEILSYFVKYIDGTVTSLTKDLKNGDTVLYLNDISNWTLKPYTSNPEINKGLIFWNYKDSTGYLYPEETYSRNAFLELYEFENINKTNHTITLNEPWNRGTIKAGTKLSQSMAGNAYNYGIERYKITTDFQTYTNVMKGSQTNNGILSSEFDNTKFRPGTKYIKILVYNYSQVTNVKTEIKDIVIQEVK